MVQSAEEHVAGEFCRMTCNLSTVTALVRDRQTIKGTFGHPMICVVYLYIK
jgi:hypothetical protein